MKQTMRSLALAAAVALAAAPAAAQVSVEVRAGGAVGSHEAAFSGLDVVPGPVVAAAVEVGLTRAVSAWAGVSRVAFGCNEGLCAEQDVTFASQGVAAGVRLHLPRLPWVRAGLLYHAVAGDGAGGSETADAGPGVELGAGGTLRLRDRLTLLPGVVYRRHTSTAAGEDGTTATLGAEVGLRYTF